MGFLPRKDPSLRRIVAKAIKEGKDDGRHKGWVVMRSKTERTASAHVHTEQWLQADGRWIGDARKAAVIPMLENANAIAARLRRGGGKQSYPPTFVYIVMGALQGEPDSEREAR